MTESKRPAVIYAAKSTEDTHDSIPDQLDDARQMAEEQGWEVVGAYSDEDFSAYSGNRGPDLARARAHAAHVAAERGCVAMLVVQHSDRISRGAGDMPGAAEALIEVWHYGRRRNVHLRSVEDDDDLRDSAAVANIGARNHADSKRKSASVKKGLKRRKSSGKPVGPIPLGYKPDFVLGADGKPLVLKGNPVTERVIDPLTRPLVERVFDLVESGATFGDVARTLNAEGVRTRPRGSATTGSTWTSRTVRGIVYNAAYAGEKNYPAMIEPERWHAIIGRLKRMDPSALKRRQGGRKTADPAYFLRGLGFCGKCGASLYTREQAIGRKLPREPGATRSKREVVRVYVCRNRRHGTGLCNAPPIPAALMEDHVLRHLNSFVGSVEDWIKQLATQRGHDHQIRRDALDRERASLVVLDARRDKLMTAYTGLVEKDDPLAHLALEPVNKLDRERAAQQNRIAEAEAVVSEWAAPPDVDAALDFYTDLVDAIHGRIQQAPGVRELNQALSTVVAGLYAEIEVDRDRLLVEFELLHPTEHMLPGGIPVMFRTRPTLPPRRLNDRAEPSLVNLRPSPSCTTTR